MRRSLLLLPIIVVLLLGSIVYAQESPFEDLADEFPTDRMVLDVTGVTTEDYLSVKDNYERLEEIYERSYGTRKIELGIQLVTRAKDVLTGKLGALLTYLFDLFEKVSETQRFTESSMGGLTDIRTDFEKLLPVYQEQIGTAETVEELEDISSLINKDVREILDKSWMYMAVLAVARGEYLIGQIEKEAPIIQILINVSADLGGDVEEVREAFDDGMLSLENARDDYELVSGDVGDGSSVEVRANRLKGNVRSANKSIRNAFDKLSWVLDELRILYSNSPWEIDASQLELWE